MERLVKLGALKTKKDTDRPKSQREKRKKEENNKKEKLEKQKKAETGQTRQTHVSHTDASWTNMATIRDTDHQLKMQQLPQCYQRNPPCSEPLGPQELSTSAVTGNHNLRFCYFLNIIRSGCSIFRVAPLQHVPYHWCHSQPHEQRWRPPPCLPGTRGGNLQSKVLSEKLPTQHDIRHPSVPLGGFDNISKEEQQLQRPAAESEKTCCAWETHFRFRTRLQFETHLKWSFQQPDRNRHEKVGFSLTRHHAVEGNGALPNEVLPDGVMIPH